MMCCRRKKEIVLFFISMVLSMLIGCDQFTQRKAPSIQEIVTEDGFTVSLRPGIPQDVLSYTETEYRSLLGLEPTRLEDVFGYPITLRDVAAVAGSILVSYPQFLHLAPADIQTIQSDFHGLSTQDIADNIDRIEEIYYKQAVYECVVTLGARFQSGITPEREILERVGVLESSAVTQSATRVSTDKSTGESRFHLRDAYLNEYEFWAVVQKCWLAQPLAEATLATVEITDAHMAPWVVEKWGGVEERTSPGGIIGYPDQNSQGGAFKYALWNTLIALHSGPYFSSVADVNAWAKEYTDACEEGETPQYPLESSINYHNNRVGRELFAVAAWTESVGEGLFVRTQVVSTSIEALAQTIFFKATEEAVLITSEADISGVGESLVYIVD